MKKFLLISGTLTILLTAGAFGWYFFSPQTFLLTKLFSSGTTKEGLQGDGRSFFPFGSGEDVPSQTNKEASTTKQTSSQTEEISSDPLQKISDGPVSGFALFEDKKDGSYVLYSEQETGHIWKVLLSEGGGKERLSNTTIPRVHEVVFLDKTHILFRYLADDNQTIETFLGTLTFSTTTAGEKIGSVDGIFLKKNIVTLSKSPISASFFFLAKVGGESEGFVSTNDGKKQVKIFTSETDEWLSFWNKENEILLSTKPSAKEMGYIFSLHPKTGRFEKLLGGGVGITAAPAGEEKIFVSAGGKEPVLALYDQGSGQVLSSSFKTLAEKCTWSKSERGVYFCAVSKNIPRGEYPDLWYQGGMHFTDRIWKLNVRTNETALVFSSEEPVDIENLTLSAKDDVAVFRNKNDLLLYRGKISR